MIFKKSKNPKRRSGGYTEPESRTFDGSTASPTAVIYRSELDYISRCILDYPNIETGGQLFGFWTSTGTPVVVYAIGPGRNSQHAPTSFFQDQEYLRKIGVEVYNKYRLQHIGEWHSHHQMDLPRPSGGDVQTMLNGVGQPGFPRMLLCIGNCTPRQTVLNAFNFYEDDPYDFIHARWDIVEVTSPYRDLIDRDLRNLLVHPRTQVASHGSLYTMQRSEPADTPAPKVHWLTENLENVETMKQFIAIAQQLFPYCDIRAEIKTSGEPLININNGMYEVLLPFGFPEKAPEIKSAHPGIYIAEAQWINESVALPQCFRFWLENATGMQPAQQQPAQQPGYETLPEPAAQPAPQPGYTPQPEETILVEAPIDEAPAPDPIPERLSPKRFSPRAEHFAREVQVLSQYFNDSDFLFAPNAEQPECCYLALKCNPQYNMIVKMEIGDDYPASAPKALIGMHDKAKDAGIPLSVAKDLTDYRPMGKIAPEGDMIYSDMLGWTSQSTLLRAALVAYMLMGLKKRAKQDRGSILDYVAPYFDNPQALNDRLAELLDKLQTKH